MSKRKRSDFWDSNFLNNRTYLHYYNRLMELAVSMFEWKNLPKSVDERFIELTLYSDGQAIFFKDDVLGELCLQTTISGRLNVYRIPISRRAFATNGYRKDLTDKNSVIIYNNYIRTNSMNDVEMYAKRLYNIDRIIDVNVNAQKTPVLLQCSEQERLTMKNMYKEYDGNSPVIFGDKNLNTKGLSVLKTDAPYVSDKLYTLKTQIWNEALTYLGVSNINIQKKERLITDEVTRNQGGTIASRYSRLESRRKAVEEINDMFDLNIEVNYREDFQQVDTDNIIGDAGTSTIGGAGNE